MPTSFQIIFCLFQKKILSFYHLGKVMQYQVEKCENIKKEMRQIQILIFIYET